MVLNNTQRAELEGFFNATIASIPIDTAAAAITTVPLRPGLTPATILGPWISALIPLGAIGALTALGILHRIRNHSSV